MSNLTEELRLRVSEARLLALLKEAYATMDEESQDYMEDSHLQWACGPCEASIPGPHALCCRMRTAILSTEEARGENE